LKDEHDPEQRLFSISARPAAGKNLLSLSEFYEKFGEMH
jgi:hypothetical protein